MIHNEIVCCECDIHVAWSDTESLNNIFCDTCTKSKNDNVEPRYDADKWKLVNSFYSSNDNLHKKPKMTRKT